MIAITLPAALPVLPEFAAPPAPPASLFATILGAIAEPTAVSANLAALSGPISAALITETVTPPAASASPARLPEPAIRPDADDTFTGVEAADATSLPAPAIVVAPQPNIASSPRHPGAGQILFAVVAVASTKDNASPHSLEAAKTEPDSDDPQAAPSAPATIIQLPARSPDELPPLPPAPLLAAQPVNDMPPRPAAHHSPGPNPANSLADESSPVPVARTIPQQTPSIRQVGPGLRPDDIGETMLPRFETALAVAAVSTPGPKSLPSPLSEAVEPALPPPQLPVPIPATSTTPPPAAPTVMPPVARLPSPPVTTEPIAAADDRGVDPLIASAASEAPPLSLVVPPLAAPARPPESQPPRADPSSATAEPAAFEIATDKLGPVAIAVDGRADALAVRFSVEHAAAATLLTADAARLDSALGASGSRLDALSVDVRDQGNRRAAPPPAAQPAPPPPPPRAAARTLRDRYA